MANYTLPYTGVEVERAIKLVSNSVAPAFSTSTAYSEGDVVVYDGLLYSANEDLTAGAWDSTKWTAVKIFDNNGNIILDSGSST